ncbi:NACHT domain-containing protein [Streptomyces sp. NPDC058614]|uniref:NACHT domain-containing protein n=1 Tax=Streptomyces sp. NPDC058614 TaxID=3346557 RepID=UPI00365EDB61
MRLQNIDPGWAGALGGGRAMQQWRHGVWATAAVVTGVVFVVAAKNGDLGDTSSLTTVLGFALSVTGLAVSLLRGEASGAARLSPEDRLNGLADQLATAVQEQWRAEWRLRSLQDPDPLQVSWMSADPWLADHRVNIGGPADLSGSLEHIADIFGQVPSRRLVLLGSPGSGKTVTAMRFTLDTLEQRRPGDPVPVLFSLSSWRPDHESLRDWMVASLTTTYPGATWSRELLSADRVLPVLDGIDEIPASVRAHAIRRLNAELDLGNPALLTCRTQTYADVVEAEDAVTAAAVIELQPLTLQDASAYLLRTARPIRGPGGQRATSWDPVVARLRSQPDEPAARALREALATPLMVSLARTVYSDGSADPAELLTSHFHNPAALEQHLLDAFVPAAFRDAPPAVGDDARRWLGFLARHLQEQQTRDLAWWQLYRALPSPLRLLGPLLLLSSVAVAVVAGIDLTYWTVSAPAVTAALAAGIWIGHLALSGGPLRHAPQRTATRSRVPREIILSAAAVSLGIALGATGKIVLDWTVYDPAFDPVAAGEKWLGPMALWMAGGMALALALTVLGVTGEPRPSTLLSRRKGRTGSLPVRIASAFGVLLAVGLAYLFIQPVLSPKYALGAAVLVGLVVAFAVWNNPRAIGTAVAARQARRVDRWSLRGGHAAARALVTALLTGVCMGGAFGLAQATTLAVRADRHSEFPAGATQHQAPDGTRYAITADGWLLGRSPDGDRYVRTPGPVHGVVITDSADRKDRGSAVTADGAKSWDCRHPVKCTSFYTPIEIHISEDAVHGEEIKLPSGRFVNDADFFDTLPRRSADWLFTASPARLFNDAANSGLAAGLVFGLVSGLAAGVHRSLVRPVDTARASSPLASLHTDRVATITRGIIVTTFGLVVFALLSYAPGSLTSNWNSVYDLTFLWILVGPLSIGLSAWGWLLTARLWLGATGQLPWRLMTFLDEAHRRGVLRQAGAVYQFRHHRLQEQLAAPTSD